jgi:solute:Na+ symporter, SSS family
MLGVLDYAALLAYLIAVTINGLVAGRGQTTTEDYFLARRSMPWWLAGISIIATETSALTFIGAPIQSLRGDWTYLQLAFGSVIGRFLVAYLLIGAFYRARCTTVYDFLALRFGRLSHDAGTLLFFVGRLLGSGVRLYAAAIAFVVVAGIDFLLALTVIAGIAVAYTTAGGIRSVMWTDILQAGLLVGGGVLALVYLVADAPGGPLALFADVARGTTPDGFSKLRVLNLSLDPGQAYTLVAGLVGSTFLTLSTHGTDQDMLQRALTPSDARGGKRSLWLSAALNIPIAMLFLCIGSALWWRLGGDAGALALAGEIAAKNGMPTAEKGFDFLFPYYIVQELPAGIRGLILAGVLSVSMSSLDSAIAALAATGVRNVWQPYVAPGRDEAYYLRVSRILSLFFGAVLVAVAAAVWWTEGAGGERQGFGILMLGLKVLSWMFPPLLGVFLLGVLTARGSDRGNLLALATGVGGLLVVEFWPRLFGAPPPFAWTWNALIGCALSFGVGVCFKERSAAPARSTA